MNNEIENRTIYQRYQAVVDGVIDGIITIGTDGVIQSANPAACSLFGYTKADLVGNAVNMLMPQPHRQRHDGYLHNYLTTGVKKIIGIGREVHGRRKDGSTFPFWLSVSEVDLETEKVFIGMVHDVTDLKKAEAEVRKLNSSLELRVEERTEQLAEAVNRLLASNKRLEHEIRERAAAEDALKKKQEELTRALERERELNELKSRFVSIASHEFRTPLSTVLSSTSLVERYAERGNMEKHDYHLKKIKSAVNHLTGILNDFLNLTKLEEGMVQNKPEELDFSAFCLEVIEELGGLCKKDQTVHFQTVGPILVFLDKSILRHILYNLISNALKYSEKDVACQAGAEDGFLRISVRDEGIGIPEQERPHMFGRFFRAKNAGTVQGTGLGLNIVKRYVEVLNGTIGYESRVGVGSTFWVKIPIDNKAHKV